MCVWQLVFDRSYFPTFNRESVCMRGLVCVRESVCVSRFVFDCAVALQDCFSPSPDRYSVCVYV